MSELFSIQLQNRQQQGGDGVWLDLPTTTEQVQVALRQIGISSDNPQGLFISGYFAEEEKRFAISYNMVLASNVDELNFLASRLETLSTGERAELNAALQAPQSELFSIGRITDFPENVDYYVHLPDVHGPAQLGDYYLNRSGMVNMPEEWKVPSSTPALLLASRGSAALCLPRSLGTASHPSAYRASAMCVWMISAM